MNKERLLTLTLIVLSAAASRLLPHPANVTPIAALALFGGAQFERKSLALIIPLLALLLSDAIIGFYPSMLVTYSAFVLIVCIGFLLRNHISFATVILATLTSSVLFFLITNCPAFMPDGLYPSTPEGFAESYTMALPFFRNSLLGDVFYSTLLFGGFALAQRKFAKLRAA